MTNCLNWQQEVAILLGAFSPLIFALGMLVGQHLQIRAHRMTDALRKELERLGSGKVNETVSG